MNLQRLKFAHARGARIEFRSCPHVEWRHVDPLWLDIAEYEYRIHPDDEHLQYGPVSQAFRDMALFTDSVRLDDITEMFMDLAGQNWLLDLGSGGLRYEEYELHDFHRLFMAELLADEGL
jgi:hypothetical protein